MTEPGLAVFRDVFRRADKNDDQAVSLEEFRAFFKDNALTTQDLDNLFEAIDTNKNKNVDCEELCAFFLNHWEVFKTLFANIEATNKSVNDALNKLAASYNGADFQSQFCSRFLLREINNQFESLQKPVNVAIKHLEEVTLRSKPASAASNTTAAVEELSIRRKKNRELRTELSSAASFTDSVDLKSQVDRLSSLLTRLEGKVAVNALDEEDVDSEEQDSIVLVKREFHIVEDAADKFRRSLKEYQQASSEDSGYLHFYIRHFSNTNKYVLYELWDSANNVSGHYTRRHFRQFQRDNVETLAAPESSVSINLPAAWWRHDE